MAEPDNLLSFDGWKILIVTHGSTVSSLVVQVMFVRHSSRGQTLRQILPPFSGLSSVYGGIVFEYLTAILGGAALSQAVSVLMLRVIVLSLTVTVLR
jgi:hypothetical protein